MPALFAHYPANRDRVRVMMHPDDQLHNAPSLSRSEIYTHTVSAAPLADHPQQPLFLCPSFIGRAERYHTRMRIAQNGEVVCKQKERNDADSHGAHLA
jgi:hypothetical protein